MYALTDIYHISKTFMSISFYSLAPFKFAVFLSSIWYLDLMMRIHDPDLPQKSNNLFLLLKFKNKIKLFKFMVNKHYDIVLIISSLILASSIWFNKVPFIAVNLNLCSSVWSVVQRRGGLFIMELTAWSRLVK